MKMVKKKGWYVGISPDEPRTFAVSEKLYQAVTSGQPHRQRVEWWCVNFPIPNPHLLPEVRLDTNIGSVIVKDYPSEAAVAPLRQQWGQPRFPGVTLYVEKEPSA